MHTADQMADFKLRLSDDLAARFDAWAAARGGRSPALRHLIRQTVDGGMAKTGTSRRLDPRPVKLTVRLAAADACGLSASAADMGLTPNAWVAALARQRLRGRPTFRRSDELTLLAVQSELRRIGVNVNQIARALNTAVFEGRVVALELADLAHFRIEVRDHILALREVFKGNLTYWRTDL